jgi:hypothetical protein
MKILKCIVIILLMQLSVVQLRAQSITVVSQLHDTLQPKTTYLKDTPTPKTKIAANPRVTNFTPNVAQGQAFFTTYNSDDGLAMDAINWGKTTVCDSEGNIWFATQGGGVSKYDGKSFITYTTEQGLANNTVRSIAADKSGNLWFGTYGGGVSKYDGKSFITYTIEQGLANNYVISIAEDKSGNLWLGTDGGGVSKYDGNRTKTKCNSNTCSHNLGEQQDQIEHNKELAKSFISYTTEQGLANNTVEVLQKIRAETFGSEQTKG